MLCPLDAAGCWPSRMAPARCRRLHAPLRPSPRHRGRRLCATFVILDSLLTATPSDGRQPRGQRRGSAAASGRRNHDVRHRRRGNELAVRLRCASRRDAATTPPPPLQPAPPHPLPQRLQRPAPPLLRHGDRRCGRALVRLVRRRPELLAAYSTQLRADRASPHFAIVASHPTVAERAGAAEATVRR